MLTVPAAGRFTMATASSMTFSPTAHGCGSQSSAGHRSVGASDHDQLLLRARAWQDCLRNSSPAAIRSGLSGIYSIYPFHVVMLIPAAAMVFFTVRRNDH
jgi:hypothetical protein